MAAQSKPEQEQAPIPYVRLPMKDVIPNTWNMNEMFGEPYDKLKKGIQELIGNDREIPPITTRPHPEKDGKFEIIDGEHRWKVLKELKIEQIPAIVIDVDDPTAILLTNNLNYLRGEKNMTKFVDALGKLNNEYHVPITTLTEYLPEGESELADLLDAVSTKEALKLVNTMDLEILDRQESGDGMEKTEETWVELKFVVSGDQAAIIDAELTRIENELRGANRRGRALEYMAVLSGQTPVDIYDPLREEEEKKKAEREKKRAEREAKKAEREARKAERAAKKRASKKKTKRKKKPAAEAVTEDE